MKKFFITVVVLIVLTVSLIAAATISLKPLIAYLMEGIIGAPVKIGEISFDAKNETLYMKNFQVYNPKGFNSEEKLAQVSLISVKHDLKDLIENKKFHIVELKIEMDTLAVTKNADGVMNVDNLKISQEDPKDSGLIQIDKLVLSIGAVVYKEIHRSGKVHEEIYRVDIKDKNFEDLPSAEHVVAKILVESLSHTAIKGAAILGVATVAGATLAGPIVIPAGVAIAISGKNSYTTSFDKNYDYVYDACLAVANKIGQKIYGNKDSGIIEGYMSDANIIIRITKLSENKTDVKVSARKLLLPKPAIAGAILYEIYQKINP